MNKPSLADKCPKCSRLTLRKSDHVCVAFRCGYVEPALDAPRPRRRRKS